MSQSRIEWAGDEAWRELLLHPALQAELNRHGEAIAKACNDSMSGSDEGYAYVPPSRNLRRDRGAIMTDSVHAKYDNAKHHTLIRKMRTLP